MNLGSLGRYEILEEIGRGTMGVVYRGYDPVIDRAVALKTVRLPDSLSAQKREDYLRRFVQETRIAGKLIHPNIVVTLDAATDEESGTPFIAMELVEGEALDSWMERRGQLGWREALDIVIPLARALDYAHQNGIVHRDVKPANVMITSRGVPKITDFGIAKLPTGGLTQKGVILGTPHFMSPEQIRGDKLDGRSDLFCLAEVLYGLVTGRPPFEGDDLPAIFHQVLSKEPVPPSHLVAGIQPTLDAVVACAMAKSPADRYASGEELAQALEAVARGEEPRPRQLHFADRPTREHEPASGLLSGAAGSGEAGARAGEAAGEAGPRAGVGRRLLLLAVLAVVLYGALVGPAAVQRQAWAMLGCLRQAVGWVGRQAGELYHAQRRRRTDQERLAQLRSEAEALLRRGESLLELGHWDQARVLVDQSLAAYRQAEDGGGEAAASLGRARLEAHLGEWLEVKADLDAALTVARLHERPVAQARVLAMLGNIERDLGNAALAEEHYQRAISVAEGLEDRRPWREAQLDKALHDLIERRWGTAHQALETVRREATADSQEELSAAAAALLAAIAFALGDEQRAVSLWGAAGQACEAAGDLNCLAEVRLLEGRAALFHRELLTSRRFLKEAEWHFRDLDHFPGLAAVLESLAEIADLEGRAWEVEQHLAELSRVRSRLGLSGLEGPGRSWARGAEGGGSALRGRREQPDPRLERLLYLLRGSARTALSEARLATMQRRCRPATRHREAE